MKGKGVGRLAEWEYRDLLGLRNELEQLQNHAKRMDVDGTSTNLALRLCYQTLDDLFTDMLRGFHASLDERLKTLEESGAQIFKCVDCGKYGQMERGGAVPQGWFFVPYPTCKKCFWNPPHIGESE